MKALQVLAMAALAAVLGSCSLLEKLTEQEFKVTSDFRVDAVAGNFPPWMVPATACTGVEQCCPGSVSAVDCAKVQGVLRCDGMCSARVPIGPVGATGVTLAIKLRDVPALRDATSLADLRISRVWVEIANGGNTLSVALPEMSLFVAKMESHPDEVRIGTIPMLKLKDTGEFDLEFTSDGEKQLGTFLANAGSPFNVILRSEILVPAGQQVTGFLSGKIAIQAKAKVNL